VDSSGTVRFGLFGLDNTQHLQEKVVPIETTAAACEPSKEASSSESDQKRRKVDVDSPSISPPIVIRCLHTCLKFIMTFLYSEVGCWPPTLQTASSGSRCIEPGWHGI
jgi:hypothetical protein